MNWRDCDDDAGPWDDSRLCWEEVEEFAGPEYLMYRDKMDEDKPTWRPPQTTTLVVGEGWRSHSC